MSAGSDGNILVGAREEWCPTDEANKKTQPMREAAQMEMRWNNEQCQMGGELSLRFRG
jgi:hypothetical protein